MTPAPGSLWTPERDARLTKLWDDGTDIRDIARLMLVSRNAVLGRVFRLRLKKRRLPIPPEERARRAADAHHARKERRRLWRQAKANRQRNLRAAAAPPPKPQRKGTLKFFDLKHDHCRFIVNERPPYRFCGQPRYRHTSWCADCRSIVFRGG